MVTERKGTVIADATRYTIEAVGTAQLRVSTHTGHAIMTLPNVAYIPRFMTNIVSLSLLMEKGVHWSTRDGCLTRNDQNIAKVRRFNGHWTLAEGCVSASISSFEDEYDEYEGVEALFSALSVAECGECSNTASYAVERSSTDTNLSLLWHARLGHPGVAALSHLTSSTVGVPKFVLDRTICETCRLAKATELVSRTANREIPEEHPFHRVSCDFISLLPGFNGDQYILHF